MNKARIESVPIRAMSIPSTDARTFLHPIAGTGRNAAAIDYGSDLAPLQSLGRASVTRPHTVPM